MGPHDAAHEGKTETAPLRFRREEIIEGAFDGPRVDTFTVVIDDDIHMLAIVLAAYRHPQSAAIGHGFDGILNEILERRSEQVGIDLDLAAIALASVLDFDVLRGSTDSEHGHAFGERMPVEIGIIRFER